MPLPSPWQTYKARYLHSLSYMRGEPLLLSDPIPTGLLRTSPLRISLLHPVFSSSPSLHQPFIPVEPPNILSLPFLNTVLGRTKHQTSIPASANLSAEVARDRQAVAS